MIWLMTTAYLHVFESSVTRNMNTANTGLIKNDEGQDILIFRIALHFMKIKKGATVVASS